MADVYGIEKVWAGIYEACRQHGDFTSERSEFKIFLIHVLCLRIQKLYKTMVEETEQSNLLS